MRVGARALVGEEEREWGREGGAHSGARPMLRLKCQHFLKRNWHREDLALFKTEL